MEKRKHNTAIQSRAWRETAISFRKQIHKKNLHFKQLYEQQINYYIKNRLANKLSENELPITSPITKYEPHHGVENLTKTNKIRVVFNAATIYHETS